MADLCFRYYGISEFPSLKDAWKALEIGGDMTYFQTYDWNEMLWNLNKERRHRCFEIGFASVERAGEVILIAPLWIVKKQFGKYNQKGFHLFGNYGWSDYLNFIYKDFDEAAVGLMLGSLKEKFGLSNFHFENIQNGSRLFDYLESSGNKPLSSQICVSLSVRGTGFDDYKGRLSKSSRQNIRTANNRLRKDGIELLFDFDDSEVDLKQFIEYRTVRVDKKNQREGKNLKWRVINFISTKILRRGRYRFADYAPFTHDIRSKFMTAKTPDGELCASFNYGVSPDMRSIVLMGVSTNPKYAKYSPGILLLFNFIEDAIANGRYDLVDFTRGNEPYKFALGGREHLISEFNSEI